MIQQELVERLKKYAGLIGAGGSPKTQLSMDLEQAIKALSSLSRDVERGKIAAQNLHDINTKLQSEIELRSREKKKDYEKFCRVQSNLVAEIESLRAKVGEYDKALHKLSWDFNQRNFKTLSDSQEYAGTERQRISEGGEVACKHEWVDARNPVVKSGEICLKCNTIRPGNTEGGEE